MHGNIKLLKPIIITTITNLLLMNTLLTATLDSCKKNKNNIKYLNLMSHNFQLEHLKEMFILGINLLKTL